MNCSSVAQLIYLFQWFMFLDTHVSSPTVNIFATISICNYRCVMLLLHEFSKLIHIFLKQTEITCYGFELNTDVMLIVEFLSIF